MPCTICKKTKSPEEHRLKKDGSRTTNCIACLDRQSDYGKKYHGVRGGFTAHRREYMMHKNYGLSREELETLVIAQGGFCAICKEPPVKRALDIDHCHKTHKVRGLLCRSCNVALGHFRDSHELLQEAILYLGRHTENP